MKISRTELSAGVAVSPITMGLMGEAARPEYYARFLTALEDVLKVDGLVAEFERQLMVVA